MDGYNENPIEMDDLGVFGGTPILGNLHTLPVYHVRRITPE